MSEPEMDGKTTRPPPLIPASASSAKESSSSGRNAVAKSGRGGRGKQPGGSGAKTGTGAGKLAQRPTPRQTASRELAGRTAEVGSAFRPGPKKGQRWRDADYPTTPSRRQPSHYRENYRHNWRGGGGRTDSFSKEAYVAANCQFVVSSAVSVDAWARAGDPDSLVPWEAVEELRVWGSGAEVAGCPICLHPPVAGKMAACGHSYCWPCILHYLALSDRPWRKCPICYEPIYPHQLRSYSERTAQPIIPGNQIHMRLMCRPKDSLHPLPVSRPGEVPQKQDGESGRFAKVIGLSNTEIVERILGRERQELEFLLATEGDSPEMVFVREALEKVGKREDELMLRKEERSSPLVQRSGGGGGVQTVFVDAFYEIEEDEQGKDELEMEATAEEREVTMEMKMEASGSPANDAYYFYQAADGQAAFLHPLTARMLMAEFGSLSAAPVELSGGVVESESLAVDGTFRARFRYLAHVPLAATISLVEIALPPALISKDVRLQFQGEMSRRARTRRQRAEAEQRRASKAAEWDRALLLQAASVTQVAAYLDGHNDGPPDIPTITLVPSAQTELGLPSPSTPPFNLALDFGPELGQTLPPSPVAPVAPASLPEPAPSFAQMLRSRGPPKPLPPNPTSAPLPPRGSSSAATGQDDDAADCSVPSYQNAFGEAIESALDLVRISQPPPPTPKGKKKKKMKGTVLFST